MCSLNSGRPWPLESTSQPDAFCRDYQGIWMQGVQPVSQPPKKFIHQRHASSTWNSIVECFAIVHQ